MEKDLRLSEQRALEAYPVFYKGDKYNNPTNQKEDPYDSNLHDRVVYEQAYTQAERDLALTWEDIERIHIFLYAIKNNKTGQFTFKRLPDEQYQEVLDRFNKQREDSK